jgi:hypothetical protein
MWIEATQFDESFMQGALALDFFEFGKWKDTHARRRATRNGNHHGQAPESKSSILRALCTQLARRQRGSKPPSGHASVRIPFQARSRHLPHQG